MHVIDETTDPTAKAAPEKTPEQLAVEASVLLKVKRARVQELNEEYRFLSAEAHAGNGGAIAQRGEIARELRDLAAELQDAEDDVEVNVPRSVTGHPFVVGERTFHPGRHVVKATVAQTLLWMIDKNREAELNRLRQNGHEVDLGSIGDRATTIERGI